MFNRKTKIHKPQNIGIETLSSNLQQIALNVLYGIESTHIDTTDIRLVGSGALVFYGIDVSDGGKVSRPNDIDLAVTASLYDELFASMATPSGIEVVPKYNWSKRQHILHSPTAQPLPIDFINRLRSGRDIVAYDARFRDAPHNLIGDTGIKIATPRDILRELKLNSLDPKARGDLELFLKSSVDLGRRAIG